MRVVVEFQDEAQEFEIPEENLVAAWRGPAGDDSVPPDEAVRRALESPSEYPPLRQMVVPGDRVAIVLDSTIPDAGQVLAPIAATLEAAGVEQGSLMVLSSAPGSRGLERPLPLGAELVVHDPSDRGQLSYLATTKSGRRVYLNRVMTDADVVVPVGRLGFDPMLGFRGPWSVLFPDMSDPETIQGYRRTFRDEDEAAPHRKGASGLDESLEVSWLLGTPFHLGLLPGNKGPVEVVAGRDTAVRERGIASLVEHWTFHADSRAELVVVGIGRPGAATDLESLGEGLATAGRLVQHGGKIIVLSRASGDIGPALRSLIDADDPKAGLATLRGHDQDADYRIARRIAQALAWADVFVLSGLERALMEDLSLIPLDSPEQARRLVGRSGSCTFVSHAELTRAVVEEDGQK
jgi:nickel-dependent lactate racemase